MSISVGEKRKAEGMNVENELDIEATIMAILKEVDGPLLLKKLDELIQNFSFEEVNAWQSTTRKHNDGLLHLLVSKGKTEGVKYLISKKFNLETQRGDGNTPLHLSAWTKKPELIATLVDAKADPSIQNKYGEDCKSIIENRERMDNLVWLDFELTSLPIEDPDILECAVIITDKNLNEIERSRWIVHYDQERLDTLSAWHQKEFCDVKSGGNGLFADVLASTTTFEAFQDELMALLLKHCPPTACSLAGSSVHCDREVLLKKMPVVYKHLSHQIIDVSTLYGLMRRWKPEELSALTAASKSAEDQVPVDGQWHRAMADIERSLASLKMFRPLFGQSNSN